MAYNRQQQIDLVVVNDNVDAGFDAAVRLSDA
jgi:hypothetical protein